MKVYIWLKKERKSGIEDLYSFDMYIFEAYEKNISLWHDNWQQVSQKQKLATFEAVVDEQRALWKFKIGVIDEKIYYAFSVCFLLLTQR